MTFPVEQNDDIRKIKMIKKSITVPIILFFFSIATIAFALAQAIQIPMGTLPEENARISTVPFSHFAHALGGVLFGIIGPIQFGRVLAKKYGRLHRIMGRIFVIAGAFLALSSISLLWQFPDSGSFLVSRGRLVFAVALAISLFFAVKSARLRKFKIHRDWMIRAYAVGIGATAVSNVFIPIFVITGEPPIGTVADMIFIGSWFLVVVFAECLVRYIRKKES